MSGSRKHAPASGKAATPSTKAGTVLSGPKAAPHPRQPLRRKPAHPAAADTAQENTSAASRRNWNGNPSSSAPASSSARKSSTLTTMPLSNRQVETGGMCALVKEARRSNLELQKIVNETTRAAASVGSHGENRSASGNGGLANNIPSSSREKVSASSTTALASSYKALFGSGGYNQAMREMQALEQDRPDYDANLANPATASSSKATAPYVYRSPFLEAQNSLERLKKLVEKTSSGTASAAQNGKNNAAHTNSGPTEAARISSSSPVVYLSQRELAAFRHTRHYMPSQWLRNQVRDEQKEMQRIARAANQLMANDLRGGTNDATGHISTNEEMSSLDDEDDDDEEDASDNGDNSQEGEDRVEDQDIPAQEGHQDGTNISAANVPVRTASAFSVATTNARVLNATAANVTRTENISNLSALLALPAFPSFIDSAASPSSSSRLRKPDHLESEASYVPAHLSNLPNEIIIEVAECLLDRDAYASAAALLGMCQHTREVLRPIMKKIKKKVVLDLDDLPWSDKKTWKKIRIITCTCESALPYSPDKFLTSAGLRTIRHDLVDLQPWAIIFRGVPDDSPLTLQECAFPSVTVVRYNTNTAIHELPFISKERPPTTSRADWLTESTNSTIRALHKRSLTKRFGLPALRFKYHNNYVSDLRKDQPGQMFVRWTATECIRYAMVEKESRTMTGLDTMQEDLREWLWNCKEHSLPFDDTMGFETISLDLYFQPRPSSTGLFYSVDDQYPPAYDVLTEYAQYAADKWLESTSLKPIAEFKLRFFVLHGGFLEREEMQPVYQTQLGKKFDGAVAVRELRIDDNDFARCVEKGGCSRCKSSIKR